MRQGTSSRRQRNNRGNGGGGSRRGGGGNQRMQVYDSNGPDVRIRGTAHQVTEKYVALAKDASSTGDLVLAESYLQYAEHYQRIINSWVQNVQEKRDAETSKAPKSGENKLDNGDLSLPSSILGGGSDVKSEERTAESTAS